MNSLASSMPPLRLIRLLAENIKRIQLVEVKPKDAVVQITGANGSGKSSLIDCIEYALMGARSLPSNPIRDGEEEGHIVLDLGEIVVRREFSRKADDAADDDDSVIPTRLIVEGKDGDRYKSPQQVLNDLWSKTALDPVTFAMANPKEQLELLRKLVTIEIDIDALQRETDRMFDVRTGVHREMDALKNRVDAYLIGPDWPTEPVDVSALLIEITAGARHNEGIDRQANERTRERERAGQMRANAAIKREEAESLRRRAAELDEAAGHLEDGAAAMLHGVNSLPSLADRIDLDVLRAKVEQANDLNDKCRLRTEAAKLQTEYDAKHDEHEDLTSRIEANRDARARAIANAKFPVEGLAFGEGEIIYKGLPLAQASSAEQMRVSVGIAMAQNPKFRLIVIKNGSLLDEHSLAIVRDMARDRGYQVLMECVDTTGKVGVYLEEGRVVAFDEEMADALV